VKGSLLLADTFTSVFNRIVTIDENNTPTTVEQSGESVELPQNAGSSEPSEWHEIECVLKRQKRSGKDMFLVRWKATKEETWVQRKDVSPAALQHFDATHPKRRRRRAH
jgi:hypothetical protein